MADVWLYTAAATLSVATALLIGALWSSVRVLGRISTVERSLLLLVTKIEQLDERLTREVKTRAGLTRAENAQDERTVAEQAGAILAREGQQVLSLERPKRVRRRI